MKQFFLKLLSANSGLSSKRFTSLWGLVLLTEVVTNAVIRNNVTDTLIWSLVAIILGTGAYTLYQLYQNKKGGNQPPSKEDQAT